MPDRAPLSIATITSELEALARRTPALGHSGIGFLVRESAEEVFATIDPAVQRSYGNFRCAYLPSQAVLAVAAEHFTTSGDLRRAVQAEVVGGFGLYTMSDAAKGRLLDALLDARATDLAPAWERVDAEYGFADPFLRAERLFVALAAELPDSLPAETLRRGAFLAHTLETSEVPPHLDRAAVLALQAEIRAGLGADARRLQIRPEQELDQFNPGGFTMDHARREIRAFVREYPVIGRSVGFRLRYSQTGAFANDRLTTEAVGVFRGAYLPRGQRALLAVASHSQPGSFRTTLRHELLGHFGTYTFAAGEKRRLLSGILASRTQPGLSELWAETDRLYPTAPRLVRAEEVWSLLQEQADGQIQRPERGREAFAELLKNPHVLSWEEWRSVADWVRAGLADGSRRLQFLPADDRAQFRLGDEDAGLEDAEPQPGLIREEVVAQVAEFVQEYPPVGGMLRFWVVNQQEELFDGRFTEAEAGRITGVYFASRSTVGLAAAAFRDQGSVQRGCRHEVLGHFALNTYRADEKRLILERLAATRNEPAWASWWANVDRYYPQLSDLARAEEIYALIAERVDRAAPMADVEAGQGIQAWMLDPADRRPLSPADIWSLALWTAREIARGQRQPQIVPANDQSQFQMDREGLEIRPNDMGGFDLVLPDRQALASAEREADRMARSLAAEALRELPDPRITRIAVPVRSGTGLGLGAWYYKPAQILPDWRHKAGIQGDHNGRKDTDLGGDGGDRPGAGTDARSLGGRPGAGDLPGAGAAGSVAELSATAAGVLGSPGGRLPGGPGSAATGSPSLDSGEPAGADHPERAAPESAGTGTGPDADLRDGERGVRRTDGSADPIPGRAGDLSPVRGAHPVAAPSFATAVGSGDGGSAGPGSGSVGGGEPLGGSGEPRAGDRGTALGGGLAAGGDADGAASPVTGIPLREYPIDRAVAVLRARMLGDRLANYVRSRDGTDQRGPKQKARDNIEAIRLIKTCALENRTPGETEREAIARFYGFGGIPQAFPRPDGSIADDWDAIVADLEAVTTPDEYAAIRRSTIDAHYTADAVVQALWAGVERMGMGGIREPFRVLEPSMGSGVFFALMPEALRRNPHLVRMGIEMDPLSAAVSTVLFPEDQIRRAAFQTVPMHYPVDLAIGNPPFGSQKLLDADRPDLTRIAPNTHGYFFAKGIDALNPGGIAAFVVSAFLLDADREQHQQFRRWMHRQAELLHAVRLPRTAFSKTAFTEVVTDLIVLRKRAEPLPEDTPDPVWIAGKVELRKTDEGEPIVLNGWYVEHPDYLLGTPNLGGKMYGAGRGKEFTLDPLATPLENLLAERFVARLPEDGFAQWQPRPNDSIDRPQLPAIAADRVGRVQPYGYFVVPEDVAEVLRERFGPTESGLQIARRLPDDYEGEFQYALVAEQNAKHFPRLAGLIALRDTAMSLIEKQLDERSSDAELARHRAELNGHYDHFVKAFGYLNAPANSRLLRGDPGGPIVLGLEQDYDKGVSREVAQRTGEALRKPSARKSDLFSRRTQFPIRPVERADSVRDALFIVLAETGAIRWHRVQQLTGKSWEEVAADLALMTPQALAFETPEGGWEERSAYLSGDILNKIEAVDLALHGEIPDKRRQSLQATRAALETVRPAPIPAELITVHPGAPYVPEAAVLDYLRSIGLESASARYLSYSGQWMIHGLGSGPDAQKYQIERRALYKLVEDLFNHRSPVIYDSDSQGNRWVNEEETALAIEKVKALRERWHEWVREDPARLQALADEYNHRFNRIVRREFDGRHLSLPGSAATIALRPHQKNAVWRACQSKSVLFDHKVGAGKTFAAIAAVMEKRRMGQARKPIVTVPNHLVGQWAGAWLALYPSARILVADEQDMDSQHRQEFLARAAYNDWDAVILSHSAFKLIPVDPEFYQDFLEREIIQIDNLLLSIPDLEKMTVKQMEKKRQSLQERVKRMHDKVNARRDQGVLHFGEIGFDYIVNDESHMHKNVPYMTLLKGVSGLGNPAGSERAEDMFVKVTQAREAGAGVLFLTGTPISNTIAEMYLLMRYLAPEVLDQQGLHSFDGWVSTFATVNEEFAFTLTGQFKSRKTLSEFNDIPTLVEQYKDFSDIIGQEDIDRLLKAEGKKGVPLPTIRGGKPQIVTCPMSEVQRKIVGVEVGSNALGEPQYESGSILHRLDNLPSKPGPGEDNILVIINDLKKVSLDARAFDPMAPASSTGKIPTCVERIHEIYRRWDADKGAQLVYLDFSTPKGARGKLSPEVREILDLIAVVEAGEDEEASDLARERADAAQEKLEKYSPMEVEEARRLAKGLQVWSAYEEIRDRLIARGISAEEIAFIHDANTDLRKEELFGKVRSGAVRVLLGSTGKMGPGMNVQDRLVGIHHLDAPYRPSDVEQRNGRIIRQGNKLLEKYGKLEVDVLYYVTENSSDAGLWQILETKDKFINSIRFASGSRTASDPDAQAMDPAAIKAMASGHELLMTEVPLRARVQNLERLEKAYRTEAWSRRQRLEYARSAIARFQEERPVMEREAVEAQRVEREIEARRQAEGKDFQFVWDGQPLSRVEINRQVAHAVEGLFGFQRQRETDLGSFEGFRFSVERGGFTDEARMLLHGPEGTVYKGREFVPKLGTDFVQRMHNLVRFIPAVLQERIERDTENRRLVVDLAAIVDQEFDRHNEMAVVREQHAITETLMRMRVRKWSQISETFEALAATPESIARNLDMAAIDEAVAAGTITDRTAAIEARRQEIEQRLRAEGRAHAQEYIDRARVAFSQPPLTPQNLAILESLGVDPAGIERLKSEHGFVEDEPLAADAEAADDPAIFADSAIDDGEGADAEAIPATNTPLDRPEMPLEATQEGGEHGEDMPRPAQTAQEAPERLVAATPSPVPHFESRESLSLFGETGDLFADLDGVAPASARPAPTTAQALPQDALVEKSFERLAPLLSPAQRAVTRMGLKGPDAAFFEDTVRDLVRRIDTVPGLRGTDGQRDRAMAYLHYFRGSADWYITELEWDGARWMAFGLADLGQGFPELGTIDLAEVVAVDAELDYHFTPKTLADLDYHVTPGAPEPEPVQTADPAGPAMASEEEATMTGLPEIPARLAALADAEQVRQWIDRLRSSPDSERERLQASLRRIAHWLDAPLPVAEAERADLDGRAGLALRSDEVRWFLTGLDAERNQAFGLRIAGDDASLGRVDLRLAMLDAPGIDTEWEPGPLRADLRDAGVLIERVTRADDPRQIWWRGGPDGAIPPVSRMEQIWEYERFELDNADVVIVPDAMEYLDLPPVTGLQWLTVSEEAAREYGKPHPVFLQDPVVLLRDGDGGVLVAEREVLERARNRSVPVPEALAEPGPQTVAQPAPRRFVLRPGAQSHWQDMPPLQLHQGLHAEYRLESRPEGLRNGVWIHRATADGAVPVLHLELEDPRSLEYLGDFSHRGDVRLLTAMLTFHSDDPAAAFREAGVGDGVVLPTLAEMRDYLEQWGRELSSKGSTSETALDRVLAQMPPKSDPVSEDAETPVPNDTPTTDLPDTIPAPAPRRDVVENSEAKRFEADLSGPRTKEEGVMDHSEDDAAMHEGEEDFDLDASSEPAVAKMAWVPQTLDEGGLFPPFQDRELPPIAGNQHGVLPTQFSVSWELRQDPRTAAKVLVVRARDGRYRQATEVALADRMTGGMARALDGSGYGTLAEAIAAGRKEIVETLERWHAGEPSGQKAGVLQRLAGLVAAEAEGTRQLATLDDGDTPENLARMALLRAQQREEPGMVLLVRWGVVHQPPRFTVAITADDTPTVRALDADGKVLAEATFEPLDEMAWLAFVDRVPVADAADADMLRNHPYGLGNAHVLQLRTPLRAAAPALPALAWPDDPQTADLPVENGPFPLGNMDRFVALRWEDEHGGRVQMAIGRSPAGYHSQLLVRRERYTTAEQPNVRTSGEEKRPARARFADVLADLHREWTRQYKRETEFGLAADHAELFQSVNDELAGRTPAIRAQRLGVDGADLVHRDLEDVQTLEIELCTFSRGRDDPETVAYGTGWTLEGVTAEGKRRYLGSDVRWERIVQAQAAAFARMSVQRELGAVPFAPAATEAAQRPATMTADTQAPSPETAAEAASETKPAILRHHALAPQIVSPEPVEAVQEIGEAGVSGTLEGFSRDFAELRLSGVWYRHPLVDHWLHSRFFQQSGWSDGPEILGQVLALKGQEIRIERAVRRDGPLEGVGYWQVLRDNRIVASITEPHLAQQQQIYRQARADGEALQSADTSVVLDLRHDQRVEAFVRSPAGHTLVVEIGYSSKTLGDPVQRRVTAYWNDANGERGMDIPLHEDANRHPAAWVRSLRPHFPEFEQKAIAQRQAIDELDAHLHLESRRAAEDLAAVPVAPVTDQASLHAYVGDLSAITDRLHGEFRERMRHLENDLGVLGSDPRMQMLYRRPSYQAFLELDGRFAGLREAAEQKAERETKERGKRLLDLLPDDASPEDIAQAVFLAHGIETKTVPPIVDAIRDRDVERVQSLIGHNSQNPASQEVFERLTGIKLTRTQAARARQIDEWADVSEMDRERIDAEKQAARDRRKWLREAENAWDVLGGMRVQTREGLVNGQDYIRARAEAGFTRARLAEYPDAAGRTRYEDQIGNPETGEVYRIKLREFRQFVTALVRGGFDPEHRVLESLAVLDAARTAETESAPPLAASEPVAPALPEEEPAAPDSVEDAGNPLRFLEDLGFAPQARQDQGAGWVQEYHLPDAKGLLRLRGSGSEIHEAVLEVHGAASPEAVYPILLNLEAAGMRDVLRRAELVQQSELNGITMDRRMIVDAEALERVWTLRGHKGLELLGTLGRFPDAEAEASTWTTAREVIASWKERTRLTASLTLLLDPEYGEGDREALRASLGVEHLRLVPDGEIRQAPLGDWMKAADFVLVLCEPLEHPAVAAIVGRQFSGERKDWNKATARILGDSVVWQRDALLPLVERRARYKAMDNTRLEAALAQSREGGSEATAVTAQAAETAPVPAIAAAPERVPDGQAGAPSSAQPESVRSIQTAEPSPMTEAGVAAEPAALTGSTPSETLSVGEAQPVATADAPSPAVAGDTLRETAWPAPEDVPADMETRALGIHSEELEAELIAGGVRSVDWSRMIADLTAQKGDAEWDSRQCCVAARDWIKAENPILWTESMHFRFRVAENPVESPTIRHRGEHHIVGFADRMVIDPWAGLHLPGKPFWFDYEDERHRSILKKLYGDPRLWDIFDLVVENERGIALPEPTEVVSEREILIALDTIQQAPQWKVMDPQDVERWLTRAVDVVTQERRGLERMADSGWIPLREEDRAAILSQDRLLFQTTHALYTSASAMGDLLSPSGQMRLWRQQLLKELPAMKGVDLLRGTLHEPAILAEVDRRSPSWERIRAAQWATLAADLAESMPEVLLHMDALYREVQGDRTIWHIVDAKSPRALPDAVDESYLVQLNCYGEGLRRVLADVGTEDPDIHLHLAYGVLAEGRTHLVEVPRDPDLVARLLEAQDDLARAVVLGLPPVPDLRPMPAEREEEQRALLVRYETLKVEQDALNDEIETLQKRISAQQQGFAPVAWLDAEDRLRVSTRQAAPVLRANSEQEWFQLAAAAGVDPTPYERETYDAQAMRAALAERGVAVEAFLSGTELDVDGLKAAIKAAGGIPQAEWTWRIDLAQTKAAKEVRQARLRDMRQLRQDRYAEPLARPAAPVTAPTERGSGTDPMPSEAIPQSPAQPTPASLVTAPPTEPHGQTRSPRKP